MDYADTHGANEAAQAFDVHPNTVQNWLQRIIPYRMTGGTEKKNLTDRDQLLLSICLFIYPDASADEICIFIIANGGDTYSREDISERCKQMEITRKRASSKEAYDAFSESSQQKLHWFITLPPPLGVAGIPRHLLIDIDETGFYLSQVGSNYGCSFTAVRARVPRQYTRSEPKINVLLGIETGDPNLPPHVDGSTARPRRWVKTTFQNCDQVVFADFMDEIYTDIDTHPAPYDYREYLCGTASMFITQLLFKLLSTNAQPKMFSELLQIPVEAEHYVDWKNFQKTTSLLPSHRQLFIMKHSAGITATGQNTVRRNERNRDACPRCGSTDEHTEHIIRCPHDTADRIFTTSLEDLESWLHNTTTKEITTAIKDLTLEYRSNQEPPTQHNETDDLHQAIQNQRMIGLHPFLCRFLCANWVTLQTTYLTKMGSRRCPKRWAAQLSGKLIDIIFDMWNHQNEVLHKEDNNIKEQQHKDLNETIR